MPSPLPTRMAATALRALIPAVLMSCSLGAAHATAAAAPVVTGLSAHQIWGFDSVTATISGSGFSGATAVTFGSHPVSPFTIVDDHTITFSTTDINVVGPVQVTAGGSTSEPNDAAAVYRHRMVGLYPFQSTIAMSCRLGSRSPFAAKLFTNINRNDNVPTSPAGSLGFVPPVQTDLLLPPRAADALDPLGDVVGPMSGATLTLGVGGAATPSTLIGTAQESELPIGTSVVGNPLRFGGGLFLAQQLQMPEEVGDVVISVTGYRADVALADGEHTTLVCQPDEATDTRIYRVVSSAPAPVLDAISPAEGPSTGGTPITITGSGFVAGMSVKFDGIDATAVQVVSPTELRAVAPARPAGTSNVTVGTNAERGTGSITWTSVGSAPSEPHTIEVPLTCTSDLVGGTTHPTLTLNFGAQESAVVGEALGIAPSASVALAFSASDVDAWRSLSLQNYATFELKLGVTGTTRAGTSLSSGYTVNRDDVMTSPKGWFEDLPTGAFGSVPAGEGLTLSSQLYLPWDLGVALNTDAVRLSLQDLHFGYLKITTCTPDQEARIQTTPIRTPVDLALKGSAMLKTVSRGSMPLAGSLTGSATEGDFTGHVALDPTQATLIAAGFLPIVAKLEFVQSGDTTGTIATDGGPATLTGKYKIKLPSMTLFGLPLASSGCQTGTASAITLKSTAFTAASGGNLIGSFAIGNLTGCGGLQGLVSALTAGTGNALALQAAPAAS